MKRFIFRLQIVLDHALEVEEEEQHQLALALRNRALKEQEIVQAREKRRRQAEELGRFQQGTFDPKAVHGWLLYLDSLANRISELQSVAEALDARVNEQRQRLLVAMQKRQVLERLRDKHHEAYRKEAERIELQTMEEAVLPRLARRQAEERAQNVSL
jgi:flagellar export protein FliJ